MMEKQTISHLLMHMACREQWNVCKASRCPASCDPERTVSQSEKFVFRLPHCQLTGSQGAVFHRVSAVYPRFSEHNSQTRGPTGPALLDPLQSGSVAGIQMAKDLARVPVTHISIIWIVFWVAISSTKLFFHTEEIFFES